MTLALSRSTLATRRERKPDQAGVKVGVVRPALPVPASWASIARKEPCQPGLRAGMRSARCN